MSFLFGMLKPYALKLLLGLAVAGAVIGVFLYGRSTGRMVERVEGMKQQLDNVENRNEVERDVDRMSGDDVTERLHDKWSRD